MTEPVTPPLFGSAIARQCTRWLGDRNCGATPVMHVAWLVDDEGIDAGFVCATHVDELGTVWDFVQAHAPSADCGMPGAEWFTDENTCRCPDEAAAEVFPPEIAISGENGGGGNRTRVTCPADSPLSSENVASTADDDVPRPLVTPAALDSSTSGDVAAPAAETRGSRGSGVGRVPLMRSIALLVRHRCGTETDESRAREPEATSTRKGTGS